MPTDAATGARLPEAVLWDLDGTLIDSEDYWLAEEIALVEAYGGTWTEELGRSLVGRNLFYSADFIRANSPVDLEPLDLINHLQAGVMRRLEEELPWRPGAHELLVELHDQGTRQALVTMSWSQVVDVIVRNLPAGLFSVVVTGDMVTKGKPDPEPYLKAAEQLGVDITQCVAVEDSVPGVTSAAASGAHTLWVPNLVDVDLPQGARRVETLVGLAPSDLLA